MSPDRCRAMFSLWAVLMADLLLASVAETSVWAAVSAAETAAVSAVDEAVWAEVLEEVSAEDEAVWEEVWAASAASADPAVVWAASAAAWAAATVADEAVEAVDTKQSCLVLLITLIYCLFIIDTPTNTNTQPTNYTKTYLRFLIKLCALKN